MLKIENITKRFGKTLALNNISLEIPPGSVTGLVGPNGSGKTTLFNLISTLIRPSAGGISLNGTSLKDARKGGRAVGYAIQNFQLHQNRTMMKELSYLVELAGLDLNDHREKIDEFLRVYKLEDCKKKKIRELSRETSRS